MKSKFSCLAVVFCGIVFSAQIGNAQSVRRPEGYSTERRSLFGESSRTSSGAVVTSNAGGTSRIRTPAAGTIISRPENVGVGQNSFVAQTSTRSSDRFEGEAIRDLKQAKSESEKKEVRESIRKRLSEKYDEILAQQEKQIETLEQRLAELRDQLNRRKDAKPRMVDLKLEMIESRAEGLGWPDSNVGDTPWLRRIENDVRSVPRVR